MTIFTIFEDMQWIIFGGIILYYLYSAYQNEQKKNATQNKNLKIPAKSTESQLNKEKTFQDILKEIEDAMQGKTMQQPIEINKPYRKDTQKKQVIYQPKLDEDSIENQQVVVESVESVDYKPQTTGYVDNYVNNYKDDYVDNYVNLQDKVDMAKNKDAEGGNIRIAQVNVEDYNPLKKDKKPKFINLNGKKLSPRDLFLANMILEKKV